MAAVQSVDFNLAGVTQPENINGDAVSPNFLSMIGANIPVPRAGDFDASEEESRDGSGAPAELFPLAISSGRRSPTLSVKQLRSMAAPSNDCGRAAAELPFH